MNVMFQLFDPSGVISVTFSLQMYLRQYPVLKCPLPTLIASGNSSFTYNASCTVPISNVVSGQYVVWISAQDNLNNYLITQLGTFQVTGDLDASDWAAPTLVKYSVSPPTAFPGSTVIATFELSGRAIMDEVSVKFLHSQGDRPVSLCRNEGVLLRIPGNTSAASFVFTCDTTSNSTSNSTNFLFGQYRVSLIARDVMGNTIFSTLGMFYLLAVPAAPASPAPRPHATTSSRTAFMLTVYSDAACVTPAASSSELSNPFVAYLNECTKVSSTGPVTVYYKPTSCVSGGNAEISAFTDSSCTVPISGGYIVETHKCLLSQNGGSQKITCASLPSVDDSVEWKEPVSQRLQLSFRTSHMCTSNFVTRSCLLKNTSFASGKCALVDDMH